MLFFHRDLRLLCFAVSQKNIGQSQQLCSMKNQHCAAALFRSIENCQHRKTMLQRISGRSNASIDSRHLKRIFSVLLEREFHIHSNLLANNFQISIIESYSSYFSAQRIVFSMHLLMNNNNLPFLPNRFLSGIGLLSFYRCGHLPKKREK